MKTPKKPTKVAQTNDDQVFIKAEHLAFQTVQLLPLMIGHIWLFIKQSKQYNY